MDFSAITRRSRYVLIGMAVIGFFGLNGVFVYCALVRPDVLVAAMRNPVSLVFILEAFLMVGIGVWWIRLVGLERPGWRWFVVLSLAGGLAFSVPAFLLLHARGGRRAHGAAATNPS